MQKPQESLDDFLRTIEPRPAAPPAQVSLCPTGEVEILRPLEVDRAPAKTANPLLIQHRAPRISWFHRSLIFGGGAVAAFILIFLSAVFIGVSEPSDRAAVVGVDTPSYESDAPIDAGLAPTGEVTTLDVLTLSIAPEVVGELRARIPIVRSPRKTGRVQPAAYIPRRPVSKPRQIMDFVPTTLIIYPENGEIKSRIEPNLTAAYKITATFSN